MGCIASGSFLKSLSWLSHLFNSKSQQLIWGSETCRFLSTAPDLQMGARILSRIRGQETTWPNTHLVRGLSTYIVAWGQSIVIILTSHLSSQISGFSTVWPFHYDIKKNIVLNYCPFVTGIYPWSVKQKAPLSWRHHILMLSSLRRHGVCTREPK